jgi:hypothetical protein
MSPDLVRRCSLGEKMNDIIATWFGSGLETERPWKRSGFV